MSKATKLLEQRDAFERLRKLLKPGDTVWTVLRHRSRSGMYRAIDLFVMGKGEPICISHAAALAMGAKYDNRHEAVAAGGCGMDMGFHLVYNLSRSLWPSGHKCAGDKRCHSNDHSNGDRDYNRKKTHVDGGYALRQRWM